MEYEPFRGPRMAVTMNAFDIQVGMERPVEMVPPRPRRGADGKTR